MLALLGSLLGLFGAFAPRLLGYFENRQNHVQEMEMLKVQGEFQMRMAEAGHAAKLAEINTQADVQSDLNAFAAAMKPSGVKWVDGYNAIVRPTIAFALFFVYAAVKIAQYSVLSVDANPAETIVSMWGNEDWAMWAAVVTFYFGNRTFNRERGR